MPRPKNVTPTVSLHTAIPQDLYLKMNLYLYSPSELQIPRGAIQRFICDRIREFFDETQPPVSDIDLAALPTEELASSEAFDPNHSPSGSGSTQG